MTRGRRGAEAVAAHANETRGRNSTARAAARFAAARHARCVAARVAAVRRVRANGARGGGSFDASTVRNAGVGGSSPLILLRRRARRAANDRSGTDGASTVTSIRAKVQGMRGYHNGTALLAHVQRLPPPVTSAPTDTKPLLPPHLPQSPQYNHYEQATQQRNTYCTASVPMSTSLPHSACAEGGGEGRGSDGASENGLNLWCSHRPPKGASDV